MYGFQFSQPDKDNSVTVHSGDSKTNLGLMTELYDPSLLPSADDNVDAIAVVMVCMETY